MPHVVGLRAQLAEQQAMNDAARTRNERIAVEIGDLKEGLEMVEEKLLGARRRRGVHAVGQPGDVDRGRRLRARGMDGRVQLARQPARVAARDGLVGAVRAAVLRRAA
ncbi:MAG: hypothetical protein MUE62_13575, partial [Burkholderiaceae bacterium]|nr:hypothetical protein [Burkholderiaceae bacterium]